MKYVLLKTDVKKVRVAYIARIYAPIILFIAMATFELWKLLRA